MKSPFHSTTICAVEKDGKFAMAGDGQVTMVRTSRHERDGTQSTPNL